MYCGRLLSVDVQTWLRASQRVFNILNTADTVDGNVLACSQHQGQLASATAAAFFELGCLLQPRRTLVPIGPDRRTIFRPEYAKMVFQAYLAQPDGLRFTAYAGRSASPSLQE